MKCFIKISAALLVSAVSVFAVEFENGTNLVIDTALDYSTEEFVVGNLTSNNVVDIEPGGSVTSLSGTIGKGSNALDNAVSVDGATAAWNNTGNLFVGDEGSDGELRIMNGASVSAADVYIGNAAVASGNQLIIEGTNSSLTVGGNLSIGANGGSGNSLQMGALASATIDGSLVLSSNNYIVTESDSTLSVAGDIGLYGSALITNISESGETTVTMTGAGAALNFIGASTENIGGIGFDGNAGQAVFTDSRLVVDADMATRFNNFQSLELTDSELAGEGVIGAGSFGAVDITGGTIDPSSADGETGTITIEGDLNLNGGTRYVADVESTGNDKLVVTGPGQVDLQQLDLEVHVISVPANENISVLDATGGLVNDFNSTTVTDELVLYDADIDVDPLTGTVGITTTADKNKFNSSLGYAGSEGVRAGYNGMKNAVFTRTKQLRRNLVSTEPAQFFAPTNAPSGAQGPGDQNIINDMHVWVQYFSGKGSYSPGGNTAGFDLYNYGTSLGFDRIFGDALTMGLNYSYARSSSRIDDDDRMDTESFWLGAYGEWVNDTGMYIDALAAYGFTDYDSVRVADDYEGKADYDGNELGMYVDVGQHYYHKNFALSPYAGLHFLTMVAEEHREKNQDGKNTKVDEEERTLFESAFGLKGRYRYDTQYGRIQVTGFAEWLHDFIEDDVETTMKADGLAAVRMKSISPDADTFNTGIGLSWISTDYMEIGIGYNGRFSGDYDEHTGSFMLDIMF